MATKVKRTAGELYAAIDKMGRDDELEAIPKMSDDEIDADVRALGGDPQGIGERLAKFARDKLRAAWKDQATARLRRALDAAEKAPKTPVLPRAELLERIAAFRQRPAFERPVAAAFRNKAPEETSDEALRAFLDELAALEAVAIAEAGDGTPPKAED